MKLVSTRNPALVAGVSEAIARGIAPDGGLYVPEQFPRFAAGDFDGATTLPQVAERLLAPLVAGDGLAADLKAIVTDAFNFPAPLVALRGTPGPASVLELFHGPTSAFKDFGARFLAASLQRIRRGATRKLTILVATSGDTGGAVAAAFHRRPGVEVAVLYPQGLVSQRQAQQLACWGDNVQTFCVSGTFDDCQRMVKEAFLDASLKTTHELSSANSINIGRLFPQMVYYAQSSLSLWREHGVAPSYVIPTGNLGNAVACVWARHLGLPIGDIVLATNANLTVTEYLHTGEWEPRQSVATLASAMDVGAPSNMERLRSLYPGIDAVRGQVTAHSVSDAQIRSTIQRDFVELGQIWCPHTATAAHVYRDLVRDPRQATKHWVLVATAHPAKFNDVVEPLIGRDVPVPPALAALLSLPRQETELKADLAALRAGLQKGR
jgi:threonine synthase